MSMSISLHLAMDPYLFCLPDPCRSAEQLEGFVRGLIGWSEVLRRPKIRILVSDICRAALIEDGEYPYQHRLRDLLCRYECEFADHETVCRVLQNIIERTPSLEEEMGIKDVLFDENDASVQPRLILSRLKNRTRSAFIGMLIVLVSRYCLGPECDGKAVVASVFDRGEMNEWDGEIEVAAEIIGVDWANPSYQPPGEFPVKANDVFQAVDGFDSLNRHIGAWDLWQNGEDESAAIDAIEMTINELVRSGLDETRKASYRLGNDFLKTARQWGFGNRSDYAMLLIESCARIILGYPKNPMKEFRTSKREDGAIAYRTHLTKKHAGLRLMLWRLLDGTLEFANVGDKDELVIC